MIRSQFCDWPVSAHFARRVRPGDGLLTEQIADAQGYCRELFKIPRPCRSQYPAGPAQLGGFLPFVRQRLDTLWAAVDNTESGLADRDGHVVSHDRPGEALEGKFAYLFNRGCLFNRDRDALREKDLSILRLRAQPRR